MLIKGGAAKKPPEARIKGGAAKKPPEARLKGPEKLVKMRR